METTRGIGAWRWASAARLAAVACALSGCGAAALEQPASCDADDPLWGTRGGPHTSCVRALHDGVIGDRCEFDAVCTEIAEHREHVAACVNGRLLITLRHDAPRHCGAPRAIGTCASVSRPAGAPCDRVALCVPSAEPPPYARRAAPWRLWAPADCEAMAEGGPANGDPCTGGHVCELGGAQPVVAWCDGAWLRVVTGVAPR